ncbi:MAG: DMT family transporter [Tannerella sp.]|jgi:transporter family protein|nr:DMT family transporter [Tannerella sp.]
MWVTLAFVSAFLLGCYEVSKKHALDGNAVLPVLFLNTLLSSLIFVPFIVLSRATDWLDGSLAYVPVVSLQTHGQVFLKSVIVLGSWISGYFSVKHLPLTLTGPIKASQPVITLLGALVIFAERLNPYQWIGAGLAVLSLFLLSTSGKKEGIRFAHNKWIVYAVLSMILGALSGLYDKRLMQSLDVMTVQVWFNIYQLLIMAAILRWLWYPHRRRTTPFEWKWSIVCISLFLAVADWIYFYALNKPDSMISIVSMIRRSNVLVTFMAGAVFFHEKNLKNKAFDLLLVLSGMIFLYLGTK